MIRIAITPAAYDAIHSTLPKGARLWPVQRQGSPLPHPRRGGRRRPPAGPPCALSPTLPMGARGADFSAPQRVCASKQRNEFGLTMDAGLAEYQFQIAANCLGGQSEFGREPAHRLPFENPPPAIRPSVGVRSNNAVNSATGGAEGAESGVATIRANAPVKIAHAEPWIGTTCRMSGGKAPVAWLLAHAALSGAVHGGYESDVWREDLAELNRITA